MSVRGFVPGGIALLVSMFLTSVGCVATAQLQPVLVAQDCTSDDDHAGSACLTPCTGLSQFGLACKSNEGVVNADSLENFLPPVAPIVGWNDGYDDGTEPCPCWEWVSNFSRAYVRFELKNIVGPVKSIEGAALTWKTKRVAGSSPKSCVQKLYETTGDWKRGETPVKLLFENLDSVAVKGGYFGVGATVAKWWADPSQNWGFMLEPSRAKTVAKSNAECLDSLESIRLSVRYRND